MEFFFNDGDIVTIKDNTMMQSVASMASIHHVKKTKSRAVPEITQADIQPTLLQCAIDDVVEFVIIENRWWNEGEGSFDTETLENCENCYVVVESTQPVGTWGKIRLIIDDRRLIPTPETLSALLEKYGLDL